MLMSKIKQFLRETHWGITGTHFGVMGDAAKEIPEKAGVYTMIAGTSKKLQAAGKPWWQGMPQDEMTKVMESIMKSNSVAWMGEVKDLPLDAEFARHIDHLAEYAPR